jgi:hypothetical protein
MTSNHLLHTHVVIPTCKSLRLDEDEIISLLSFSLNTPALHLTSFQPTKQSPASVTANSTSRPTALATSAPPLYSLSGSIEVIPLASVPLGHLEGVYSGHLNSSSKSYCRMGCHHPTTATEKMLREEYWARFISSSSATKGATSIPPFPALAPASSPSRQPRQLLSSTLASQDTVTYLPSHLSLTSLYFLQKGFSATITFAAKQLDKTIDYLNRYPVILEALLDSSSTSTATTNTNAEPSLPGLSNYFLGKELSSSMQGQHKELLLGSISCCISSGNAISSSSSASSRQKLKQHSVGMMTSPLSVFDALGVTLPGSVHIGVSYHGTPPPPPPPFPLLSHSSRYSFLSVHSSEAPWQGRCGVIRKIVYHLASLSRHHSASLFLRFYGSSQHVVLFHRLCSELLLSCYCCWRSAAPRCRRDSIILRIPAAMERVFPIRSHTVSSSLCRLTHFFSLLLFLLCFSRHLSSNDFLCLDLEYTREVVTQPSPGTGDSLEMENSFGASSVGSRHGGGKSSASYSTRLGAAAGGGIRYILRGRLREKGKIQATDR